MVRPAQLAPIALAAVLAACARDLPPARGAILITLDTTRADALGCYGGSPLVTPHLDTLARESLLFEAAHTVAPLTLPAHASMLTGLYPPRHRVHDNGIAVLPASAETLAERARARGVQTGAVVAATVLDRAFALDQGFEFWEQPERAKRQHSSHYAELNAQQVVVQGRRWLARRDRERPFFLWLHFYDPHVPYMPPSSFQAQAGGDLYLGEVAAVDAAIGDLLAPLRVDGTLDEILVIVVADHGESLGDHGEPTHGSFCYEAAAHVPLLVRYPGGRRAGQRTQAQASVADVFPTVLEALELGSPGDVDGVSLWRADPAPERGVYLESYSGWLNYGWSPLAGWVQQRVKYLHSSAPELYRLDVDSREANDLYEPGAPEAAAGLAGLAAVWGRPRLQAPEAESFSPELLAELRLLGYGTTGAPVRGVPSPLEPSERPAPRERAGELVVLLEATALGQARQHGTAVELLRELVGENPQHCLALDVLGFNLMQLGAFEEALDTFQRRLACGPERADTWLNLGLCRERLGDVEHGIEAVERARLIDPDHAQVRDELARMLAVAGRTEEAAELLRDVWK